MSDDKEIEENRIYLLRADYAQAKLNICLGITFFTLGMIILVFFVPQLYDTNQKLVTEKNFFTFLGGLILLILVIGLGVWTYQETQNYISKKYEIKSKEDL